MTERKRGTLRRKLLILVASGALALGAGEVVLRWAHGPHLLRLGHQQLMCRHDPLYGWVKIPDGRGTFVTSEYTTTESFNSRGLRSAELPYEKPEGGRRVLILGDSFAEGYTVDFPELFSEELRRRLAAEDLASEIVNAGTGGYSTDQELLWFREEGRRYEPDVTVLLFTDNDPWFNGQGRYWRGYKPFFELEDGALVLRNVPVPPPREPRGGLPAIKRWLSTNSYLYHQTRAALTKSPRLHALAISLGIARDPKERASDAPDEGGLAPISDDAQVYQVEARPEMEHAWETTDALLDALRADCEAAGSELLVVYVPSWFHVYPPAPEDTYAQTVGSASGGDPGVPARRLAAICARRGIRFLDPTEAMQAEARLVAASDERLYFVSDGHWTGAGNRFVGAFLADAIAPGLR